MRLADRTALVTGAGYGNGRGIALRLASEGARILVADIDEVNGRATVESIVSEGGEAAFCHCNVGDRGDVEAAVAETLERWGSLHIMVANAGINDHVPFLEMTDEQWHRVLDVNLTGAFHCGQAAARRMAHAGGGAIVNVTSVFSQVTGPGTANYSASKGGVRQLTRAMALDLAPHGIRVNAVSPGAIRTRMSEGLIADPAGLARFLTSIPLDRIGDPSDIAAATAFLASDDSAYITGIELVVDGGWTLRAGAGPGGIPAQANP